MGEKGDHNPDELRIPNPVPDERVASAEEITMENAKEAELSPEAIEKIVEKVQDINKYGIGYSALSSAERLKSVLEHGLLGTSAGKKEWLEKVGKLRIYFNIVGRSADIDNSGERPEVARSTYSERAPFTLLFDVSGLNEVDFEIYQSINEDNNLPALNDMRPREYVGSIEEGDVTKGDWKKSEDIKVSSGQGFFTKSRIAPRRFLGIAIGNELRPRDTVIKQKGEKLEIDQEVKIRNINLAIKDQKEVFVNNPNLSLPIYSVDGDLLWPKQMSYGDVKKFVEERDKNKKETKA